MRNFLQNLLIFFSFCLCGLIAIQWVRETDLRKTVQSLNDTIHDRAEAIQNLQGQVRRDEAEIQRLDALKDDLNTTVKSNQVEIVKLSKNLEKADLENEKNLKQLEVYKDALQTANTNIVRQNEEIKKQNDEMKKLSQDRNELIQKYNKLAADYGDLVNKWNKQQEELAHMATNTPAPKK